MYHDSAGLILIVFFGRYKGLNIGLNPREFDLYIPQFLLSFCCLSDKGKTVGYSEVIFLDWLKLMPAFLLCFLLLQSCSHCMVFCLKCLFQVGGSGQGVVSHISHPKSPILHIIASIFSFCFSFSNFLVSHPLLSHLPPHSPPPPSLPPSAPSSPNSLLSCPPPQLVFRS